MDAQAIRTIQKTLFASGFDPGPIDGIWGRRTIDAVRAFQRTRDLKADGVFGPKTSRALFGSTSFTDAGLPVPWMTEAARLLNTREVPGADSNSVILDMAERLGIAYASDATPWCGLFLAHVIAATLPGEALPASPLWARAWRAFGEPVTPGFGSVMVFYRGDPGGSQGHVGFYAGENGVAYRVLGGNQSDTVSYAWIEKKRLLASRWPKSARSLNAQSHIVMFDSVGELSVHEA
jgi:uncharacterized protein (TIGR02594 family)